MLLSCTAVYSTPAVPDIDSYNFDEFFAEFTVYRNSHLQLGRLYGNPQFFSTSKTLSLSHVMLVDLICSRQLLSSKL
jgi:hypothetical protein